MFKKPHPSSLTVVIVSTALILIAYGLGAYNHEQDIIKACILYGNANNISWTGKLGLCMKIDNDNKDGIIITQYD